MTLTKSELNSQIAQLLSGLQALEEGVDERLEASDGDKLNEVAMAVAEAAEAREKAQRYMKRVNGVYSEASRSTGSSAGCVSKAPSLDTPQEREMLHP